MVYNNFILHRKYPFTMFTSSEFITVLSKVRFKCFVIWHDLKKILQLSLVSVVNGERPKICQINTPFWPVVPSWLASHHKLPKAVVKDLP